MLLVLLLFPLDLTIRLVVVVGDGPAHDAGHDLNEDGFAHFVGGEREVLRKKIVGGGSW